MINMFRFLGFLAIAALAISIAGDVLGTDLAHPSQAHTGMILRRAAANACHYIWLPLGTSRLRSHWMLDVPLLYQEPS